MSIQDAVHILVTNDDGITFPGLLALAQALREVAPVTVLAPDHNWSASGHVKTMHRPLRVKEVKLADGTPALACDGAPSDCVALGLLGFPPAKITLVVSGINPTPNLGHDVTYSGTVTAAMEAAIGGLPGIAVSLESPADDGIEQDFHPAAKAAALVVERVIAQGLPPGVFLNVNVPHLPFEQIKGIQVTRQGQRMYHDRLDVRKDPRGRPYYWIGGDAPTSVPDEGSDYGALCRGYVAITPLQLDLTAYGAIGFIGGWEF